MKILITGVCRFAGSNLSFSLAAHENLTVTLKSFAK